MWGKISINWLSDQWKLCELEGVRVYTQSYQRHSIVIWEWKSYIHKKWQADSDNRDEDGEERRDYLQRKTFLAFPASDDITKDRETKDLKFQNIQHKACSSNNRINPTFKSLTLKYRKGWYQTSNLEQNIGIIGNKWL